MPLQNDIALRSGNHTLSGVPRGSESLLLAQIAAHSPRPILFIASSDRDMNTLAEGLRFFAPEKEVLLLPAWDCLPYDRASPNATILAQRMVTLSAIAQNSGKPRIVITTLNAALQKMPPRSWMQNAGLHLTVGATFSHEKLVHFLSEHGYRRSATAMDAGEFAVRGSIIDVISSLTGEGIRLDSFGDTLESIRTFDPVSQRSSDTLTEITFTPASEVILNDETVESFRTGYRAAFGAHTNDDNLYESISEHRTTGGVEHLLPLFYPKLDTLFEYVPDALVVLDAQHNMARSERLELVQEYYDARAKNAAVKNFSQVPYRALPPDTLYLNEIAWQEQLAARDTLTLTPFSADEHMLSAGFKHSKNFAAEKLVGEALFAGLRAYATVQRERGRSTIIACYSEGSRERIAMMLHEHGLHPLRIESFAAASQVTGKTIGLCILGIELGFEADTLTLISEQDLLGDRIIRTQPKRKKNSQFLLDAAHFIPGELIVHQEHGIGRFEGLVTLEVLGARHDCLKLIYEGDDKLFLPVENIELLSRYGSEEDGAKLDKLGSASWQARKAVLKERITIMAHELLRTAALRALRTAPAYSPPAGEYEEFCSRFPYTETEDQARAIDDVLADIASGKPTDRLICGDVGFGKTEVALRAAFVAASSHTQNGKVQVAIVCPTTLLCRQHFRTFSERFEGLPFTIRQMSRLSSAKQNKQTTEDLADGKVDIVIGTHALLGKSVIFKNLGLLVIDEEQHFGVAQKEKLKALREDIHVITLSATPIPRTLQLALSGVRELSLIATPPVDRLAVRTFVTPVDEVILREAILREYHRGGKIFYVTPRIEYMAELQAMLVRLVPEIRVASAHGQLAAGKLDDIMNAFCDGKYDLLLSTTIVESGLDIPTANTLIVDRAQLLGLSQLYQLRGRVGRSKTRAYAYYTLPHRKNITRGALRRLEVMQTLDGLGAGFSLASHDMDIRGFGNLLGSEQSGQVREVGIELYQQMLEEAVAAARSDEKGTPHAAPDDWSPQINLGITVLIPEEYVQDLELRLTLYRRAATLADEAELHEFAAELVDRFGAIPQEVEHLLAIVRIKQLCRKAGIERVDAGPKGLVLSLRNNLFAEPEKLLAYIAKQKERAKLRPDQKIVLLREWNDIPAKINDVRSAIAEIAGLCG